MGTGQALLCYLFALWGIAGAILMNLPKRTSSSAEAFSRQLRCDMDEFIRERERQRQRLRERLLEIASR